MIISSKDYGTEKVLIILIIEETKTVEKFDGKMVMGYMQGLYNPQMQQQSQAQQYYAHFYGGSTSNSSLGVGPPFYYPGYSMQPTTSPRPGFSSSPQAHRMPGPSYLYYPTQLDGAPFTHYPNPAPAPAFPSDALSLPHHTHPVPTSSTGIHFLPSYYLF